MVALSRWDLAKHRAVARDRDCRPARKAQPVQSRRCESDATYPRSRADPTRRLRQSRFTFRSATQFFRVCRCVRTRLDADLRPFGGPMGSPAALLREGLWFSKQAPVLVLKWATTPPLIKPFKPSYILDGISRHNSKHSRTRMFARRGRRSPTILNVGAFELRNVGLRMRHVG